MPSAARSSFTPRTLPIISKVATRVGVGNGVSEKAQVAVSGPIDSAGTLRYRASFNFYNTDGYLENTYLDRKADPVRDYSGRLRLLWKPADEFSADLRFAYDQRRDDRLLLRHSPQRRGQSVQQLHHARRMRTITSSRSRTTIWARTTATSWIPRSSSTTTPATGRSPRSRTSTTPRRSTPATPTTSGPVTTSIDCTTSSTGDTRRQLSAVRSMRARASSST